MVTKEWTYGESNEWTGKCLENEQSPINIDTELIQHCKNLCELKFMYKPSRCLVEYHKDQNIKLEYDKGSGVIFNNQYYKLKEITFHTPSLHQIDGNTYDMEICLIHSLSDVPYDRNGLVISIMCNEGNYYGDAENFINQFINEIKIDNKENIDVSDRWGANMLLPKKKSFFMYNGSLHFPPCSQMKHIVMDSVNNIGPVNLEILQKNLGKNTRNIQPLGPRRVFYNTGKIIELKDRSEVKSDDQFLRCKKKGKNETITKSTTRPETEDIGTGMSIGTKLYIKNVFIFINIITIFVNAFFLATYLFKHEYAQKMIITIVGVQKLGNPKILTIWRNNEKCK